MKFHPNDQVVHVQHAVADRLAEARLAYAKEWSTRTRSPQTGDVKTCNLLDLTRSEVIQCLVATHEAREAFGQPHERATLLVFGEDVAVLFEYEVEQTRTSGSEPGKICRTVLEVQCKRW